MRPIGKLLRILGYLFHVVVSLALLAIGGIAMLSDANNTRIEMLPWKGEALNVWLVILGVVGLISVALAVLGKLRVLYMVWCGFALVMLIRGVFFVSGVTFDGSGGFQFWLWTIFVALLAFLGSLTKPQRPLA